jgi:restriction system protein
MTMNVTPDLPDYRQLMLPLLRIAAGGETSLRAAVERLSAELGLDAAQRARTLPGRRYAIIDHRAHWARTHMMRAGLIERRWRGAFRATARGRELLATGPEPIDFSALATTPEIDRPAPVSTIAAAPATDAALAGVLIDRILAVPHRSDFFEELVIDLLTAMGYGDGRKDAAIRLGRSGDGGVDAVILLDPLGLDRLYVQAKCYRQDHLVDAPAVRDFAGSLEDKKTARGVLLTTSGFTRGAREFVPGIPRPIALIDGPELARLMIAHGVGVKAGRTAGTKEVDMAYFGRQRT